MTLSDGSDVMKHILGSVWKGIRGSKERPIAIKVITEGKPGIKISPCEAGSRIEDGCYMPVPDFDKNDCLSVPGTVYLRLLQALSMAIKNIE